VTDTSDWQNRSVTFINNPMAVQRQALAQFEARTDGTHVIVDPSNPFMFLLEAATTTASAAAVRMAANMRRVYPTMAMTENEVYDHMSDVDFAGRFGSPARGEFVLWLELNEIYQRAVDTDAEGVRQLTIPRNTEFKVADITFTMQYPVDIRIMPHEGLNIVYDTSVPSPLQTLESNQVKWNIVNLAGVTYVRMILPVYQFQIVVQNNKLTNAGTFEKTWTLTGQFYYARAYYTDVNGNRKEMRTTHSEQVFDPFVPTMLLRLAGNKLTGTIPTIYLTNGLVTSEVVLEIYQTDGPIVLPMSSYQPTAFSYKFWDRSREGLSRWSAPMTVFANIAVNGYSDVNGGTNQISFEEQRNRVINSSLGNSDLPITGQQLSLKVANRGYRLVPVIDRITNRQYQATRLLPTPTDGTLVSGAGATMQTLVASMEQIAANTHCVSDNGDRITILPKALYSYVNGKITIVPEATIDMIQALPPDVRSRRINEATYLFSPFHYVLDRTEDRFALRPYYLDNPVIETKSFVSENPTTGIAVGVDQVEVRRVEGGYALIVTCKSGDDWKLMQDDAVHCQLSFIPHGERDYAHQNGVLYGINDNLERMYTFFLGTKFDLNSSDALTLNTFQMYDQEMRDHATALLNNFDIVFAATGLQGDDIRESEIDTMLGTSILPPDTIGLTRERISLRLGSSLADLWAAARSVPGSEDYKRYPADVGWTYEEDSLEKIEIINGEVVYKYYHRKGDPVLDPITGQQLIRYKAGEIMLDGNGNPIAISSRKMLRHSTLFLIDGVYWFSDDLDTVTYRDSIAQTVVTWLDQDIAPLTESLLEETRLFFYTQSTIGRVDAVIGEDREQSIDAAQSFAVNFVVEDSVYRDESLKTSLERMAVRVISDELTKPVVAMNQIISTITDRAGTDIVGVSVSGLGGTDPETVVMLLDDSARLGIRRIAIDKADGTIAVKDDVEVRFTRRRVQQIQM